MSTDIYTLGLDPAKTNDFFGVCIHKVVSIDNAFVPKLVLIDGYKGESFVKIQNILDKGIFSKYQFKYIHVDYTNQQMFTDLLIDRYGDDIVKKFVFSNKSKQNLMTNTKSFMNEGYEFPPPPPKGVVSYAYRKVLELKKEITQEQVEITDSNNIKFVHKGKHNDKLHAFALSLYGARLYMNDQLSVNNNIVLGGLASTHNQKFGQNRFANTNRINDPRFW